MSVSSPSLPGAHSLERRQSGVNERVVMKLQAAAESVPTFHHHVDESRSSSQSNPGHLKQVKINFKLRF